MVKNDVKTMENQSDTDILRSLHYHALLWNRVLDFSYESYKSLFRSLVGWSLSLGH
jgi:hypothetical protein